MIVMSNAINAEITTLNNEPINEKLVEYVKQFIDESGGYISPTYQSDKMSIELKPTSIYCRIDAKSFFMDFLIGIAKHQPKLKMSFIDVVEASYDENLKPETYHNVDGEWIADA